jgi:hypothetical protein
LQGGGRAVVTYHAGFDIGEFTRAPFNIALQAVAFLFAPHVL